MSQTDTLILLQRYMVAILTSWNLLQGFLKDSKLDRFMGVLEIHFPTQDHSDLKQNVKSCICAESGSLGLKCQLLL